MIRNLLVAFSAKICVVLAVLAASTASAHIVTEVPWHPVAASYRTMLFLGNLRPVPWQKIEAALQKPLPAAVGSKSALQKLQELDARIGDTAAASMGAAIAAKDRQALFAASTRTLSQALRRHLELASDNLNDQATATRHVEDSRDIYRAIADFLQQADPQAYRQLGRAWLKLSNSLGSSGVAGHGRRALDETAFAAAREVIETYLRDNFEAKAFTAREKLAPLPESVVASGKELKIAPWLPPGSNLNDQDPLPLLILNFEERGIDEKDLPLIAYGDMLFDSPEIFGTPARSLGLTCSMCHNRSDINQSFFIPGISHQPGAVDVDGEFFNPLFNDRRNDSLDIPSLRGLRFTGPYGRDGRFGSLRDFTRNVIVNEFGGKEPTPFMLDALVAYMLEFDFLPNSKVDGQGRLAKDVPAAAKRGEMLFKKPFAQMDGKSCASCHVPSANFLDKKSHDIGSGSEAYTGSRAAAFDTPTLLGARFTAPYFHNGSLPTLASVVDWFDSRFKLELKAAEKADLTAYLKTVGDADEPYEVYKGKHTPFRLAFEELTTFASTLDTLLPAKDAFHAKLMIDTVAPDLSADASGMANLTAKPKVYALSALLHDIGKAIDSKDWDQAEASWKEFKRREAEYDAAMY